MWIKLDESKLEYVEEVDSVDVGSVGTKFRCTYGEDGKLWPRITIAVYDTSLIQPPGKTFELTCCRKNDAESWWNKQYIPFEKENGL